MSWNSPLTTLGDHTMLFVFNDKMIKNQRIWLKFSQLIIHLLFYIPFKFCKHSLNSINSSHHSTNFLITPRTCIE